MINNIFEPWLNNLGSISSIIGLIIALITIVINIVILVKVSNIKKSFVRKIRYSEILKDLKSKTSKLSKIIFVFDINKKSITEVFSEIKAILRSIQSRDKDKDLEEFRTSILEELNAVTVFTEDSSEKIYNDLVEFQGLLEQKVKDMKWEENE